MEAGSLDRAGAQTSRAFHFAFRIRVFLTSNPAARAHYPPDNLLLFPPIRQTPSLSHPLEKLAYNVHLTHSHNPILPNPANLADSVLSGLPQEYQVGTTDVMIV